MPIDPNIALQAQGIPIPNISQSVMQGQQMALQRQAMLQMQQERAAQTQEIQQKAAAAQLVAQHDAAMDQIMKSAYTPDPDTGAMLLDTNKIQQGVIGANMGHLWPQMSESIDKMNQSMLDANAKRRETLAAGLNALDQTPDELKPQAAQAVLAGFRANNLMTPDHVATALQQLGPNPTAADVHNLVQQYGASMPEFQTLVKTEEGRKAGLAKEAADTAAAQATANEKNIQAATSQRQQDIANLAGQTTAQGYAQAFSALPPARQTGLVAPGAWTPNTPKTLRLMGMTPQEQVTTLETAQHDRATEAIARGELGLKQRTFDAQYGSGTNPQTGQPYSDVEVKNLAQNNPQAVMIANYQVPGPSSRNVLDLKNAWILRQVKAINPNYSSDLFGTRRSFITGTQGQSINAINTAMGHLDQLNDVASALQNGNFRPGNAVYQGAQQMFGGAGPTDFNTLKQFLDGELAKVAGGGSQAHEGEIAALRQNINSASSPEQIQGFIKTAVRVMNSKLGALDYQYHQAMGAQDPFSALSPESKAVVQKFVPAGSEKAPSGTTIYARDPQGVLHQAAAGTPLPAGWKIDKGPGQ